MSQKSNDPVIPKSTAPPAQSINRYPQILDAISIIFHNVLEGIKQGQPAHMSVGQYSLIAEGNMGKDLSLKGLKSRFSHYEIIASDSDVSSNVVTLKRPKKYDIFEEGEFIYTCQTGYFHFTLDSRGVLSKLFSEFYGDTPGFIVQLIKDFPGNNFMPDNELLKAISNNNKISNRNFRSGFYPWRPRIIEVD